METFAIVISLFSLKEFICFNYVNFDQQSMSRHTTEDFMVTSMKHCLSVRLTNRPKS